MTSEEHKPLKEKFDKVCSQGHQIQKTLKYHQNQLKTLFSSPSKDLKELESSIDKLAQLYSDVDTRINQDYPQLKFNFFPANMDVSYSVKYAGGTSPNDLTLCHNRKSKLKEIRSSLKRKIISKKLHKSSCVEEKDCVIAVDMKRMVVRGVVMGCVQGAVVTILDIDTGDYKMATLDNIYELDEEAVSLYALCVRCSLDGDLTDLKEYWTADLSNYFITALKFGELVIEPSHNVDESTIPPKFKVTMEIFVDDTKVLNVNQWICEQLLPLVKQEAENCLDLNKVIRGLDSKVLMPYLPLSSEASVDSSSNLSDMNVCSSQIISSPEYSAQSSSSDDSEEYSVDIQIDKFNTPTFLPCQSPVPTGAGGAAGVTGKKEIDVYFTNENMASPSSESLVAERSKSKCDCGTNCASIVSCCPPELLTANPKVPRITTVIPSLARIPHGEPFYYTMKNKSKSSLLPTPSTNNTLSANKSETEVRCPEYYNRSNGRIANDLKHKSDNSLSSSSCNYSNLRRGPRSNVYSNSILPPYMEDSYAASGDAFVAGAYDEKLVPIAQTNGPNSRGEGISLKEQHFCVAEHLDKVQSVKLPGSVLLVEPGQERKALVSFIETPGKFYVNIIEENTAHMEQLEEELCAHYSQVNNLVSLVTIEEARYHLGEFVAAKWKSDGRWYRARVIDWNVCVKNSKIAILYVDHGNLDLVPLDYIQPLDPHFTHCATMAQPCHLANLAPVSSVGWSEAAIEMFSQFCNKTPHEVFYLTFQPSNNNDTSSSWSVVIRNEGGECINDLLVSSGFAIHTKVNGHATNPTPVPPTPAPTPPADSKDKGTYQLINRLQDMVQNIKVKNSRISENISPEKVKNSPQVSALPTGVDHNGDLIDLEINNEDPLINIRSEAEPDTPELSIHILDQENISEKSEDVPHASSEIGFIPVSTSTVHVMPSPASIVPVTTVTTTPISRPISQNSPVNRSTNIPTLPPDVSSDVRNLLEQTDLLLSSRTFPPTSSVPNTSRNIPVTFVPTPMSSSLLRPISRPSSTMSQCGADIPIPGMEVKEEDIKGEQCSKPVESDLGRMSRNSNVSCMSSEQLSLVGQLLDRYNRDIENTAHVLRKAQFMQLANIQHLSDNERKLAEIGSRLSSSDEYKSGKSYVRSSKLNRSNDCKISSDGRFDHAVEIQEKICNTEVRDAFINEPSTSEPLLLNNESKLCNMQRNLKSNDGRDNCLVTQVGEQNTLSIKSSGHIVNRLKFPSHRDVKNTNDQSNNEFKMRNTDHKAYLEHGTGMDHKNVEYGTHIDYKVQSDYQRSTTNVLLGDRKTSSLDKSLNENLLVSSSDSSLMGSKVPPVSKKSKSRNVVKANFTTIISSLQTDEREKQKRIQEYVEATLQQAKENGSLDNTKHIDRSFETQDKVSTMEAKPSNLLNFEENERLAPEKLPHENEHHVPESKIITQDNKTNVPSDAIANKSPLDSKVNEEKLVDLIVNEEVSPDTKEICVPDMNDNDSNINTGNSRESKVTESTSLEAKPDKVRLQEVSVKKKKSSRGRPRKFHSNHPGPSLKTLAQNKNIFECLTNSADVSSEDTSTSAPKPRTRISTPNATLPETSNIPDTTSATNIVPNGPCETKYNTDSSGPRKKCRDSSPNRIKGPSASGESAEKTQKWFWRTLKQETLLQSKASKTIRIRVTHIPAIGEFYCQTLGVFPDYELGFKNLFFKCNSPQVFSEFQPVAFIRPGKLVMTCDPKSNKWYRSVVQAKVEGQDLFKVFFVDFGTENYVPSSAIREIQPDSISIPYQAIHCQLHNIAVCPNRDFIVSQDYVKYLRVWSSMLQIGQTYQAKIMSVKSLVEVSMEDSEGFDLGQLLALQCCTPYVELKSDNLPGAWSEFMTHP